MDQQILDLINEEISRQVNLKMRSVLDVVSQLYEIPIERLVKDTRHIEGNFCKGILKSKQRCLKNPKENGYCGFHQCQNPHKTAAPPPPLPAVREDDAPWN